MQGGYPAMSLALEQALSKIEKGAVERLEVLRSKKELAQKGEMSKETVPQLRGQIEKVEEEKIDVKLEQTEGEQPAGEKGDGSELTTGEQPSASGETGDDTGKKTRSTTSISKLREEQRRVKTKEQERPWSEGTSKGLGEIPTEELDLEAVMLSLEEGEKQQGTEKERTEEEEGYGRVYIKTHEKRAELSMS